MGDDTFGDEDIRELLRRATAQAEGEAQMDGPQTERYLRILEGATERAKQLKAGEPPTQDGDHSHTSEALYLAAASETTLVLSTDHGVALERWQDRLVKPATFIRPGGDDREVDVDEAIVCYSTAARADSFEKDGIEPLWKVVGRACLNKRDHVWVQARRPVIEALLKRMALAFDEAAGKILATGLNNPNSLIVVQNGKVVEGYVP